MKTLIIFLLLAVICNPAKAQIKVKLHLFYQEPQVGKPNADPDSIDVYVNEPFQQTRTLSSPDLGFETTIELTIQEYCPIQVCKNAQCIDLFIDSEEIQILINPEQFRQSKSLNSPLSKGWQSVKLEKEHFYEAQADSLDALFKKHPASVQIVELYKHFNAQYKQMARSWITNNPTNAVGWNLLLRVPELFDINEIVTLTNAFSDSLLSKSTELVKARLVKYNDLQDPTKSIYSIFSQK